MSNKEIDEAIKRNKDLVHFPNDVNDPDDRKAIQLGIEALERHKELIDLDSRVTRDYLISKARKPLPSETEGEK